MSSTAARQLASAPTPFAAAQAARRRAAEPGFHAMVDDEDQGVANAPAQPRPAPRPRATATASASGASNTAASPSAPPPIAPGAVQPVAAPTHLATPRGTSAATGGSTPSADGAAADGSVSAEPAALSAQKMLLTPALPEQLPLVGVADEDTGDAAGTPVAGAAAQGDSPPTAAGGAAPPGLAAGSSAQPLMAALSGAGATSVKAQAGPTAAGLRAAAAGAARGKTASGSDLAGKASAAIPAPAPAEASPVPTLLAVADKAAPDDTGGDDTSDEDGSAAADGTSAATGQTGVPPFVSAQTQSPAQTAGAATPMSATAADLAAQMAARVSSGSSRFQLQLNPLGLGRVDVSVSISGDRQLTAALSFADPQTASALSAHAGELKTALEQAGFDIPAGGFDFTGAAAGALGANLQGGFDPGGGSGGGFSPSSGGRQAAFSAGEALAAGSTGGGAWAAADDSRLDIRIWGPAMSSSITNYLANQSAYTASTSASSTPSSATASSSASSGTASDLASGAADLSTSYQTFLTLLTTQLQNQDPSSPMDPNQFTTELVQMTGVQQQLLSNQLLQQLVNASPGSGVSSAVGLIGKQVTATSATANLTNGQASWTYGLPSAASNATVSVSNSTGQVVYTGVAPSFAAGSNTFTWNGQSNSGVQLPDGTYTLSVAATDASGGAITPTLSVSGTASSVQSVNGTTMITVGSSQVPVTAITNVGGS